MNNVLKKFGRSFLVNLKNIITALLLSIVIWFAISLQIFPNITTHIENIPIEYTASQFMRDNSLQISSVDLSQVTVQISGKRYEIGDMSTEDFTASLDLSGISEAGEHTVDIIVRSVDANKQFDIISENLTAVVNVRHIVTKEIPVTPNISGVTIADDMQVEESDIVVTPATVFVTGEESLVNSIRRIEAKAKYDGTLIQSSELQSDISIYNQRNAKMENADLILDTTNFTVEVPIYKVKTLPLSVSFTSNQTNFDFRALDYSLSIDEITIASPDNSIDNLSKIDIGEISLNSLNLKDIINGITLTIKLPEGYKNISGTQVVKVFFNNADSLGQLGFTVPKTNFYITNAPSNYDVEILTNELAVTVVGLSSDIQEMTSDDISISINLFGVEITEGTKSLTASFRIAGTKVGAWVSGEEYKIDIKTTAKEVPVVE